MRIDLEGGGKRPLIVRAGMALVKRYIGTIPGPMLFMTYRMDQIPRGMVRYMMRSVARRGAFSKSERELFATLVSDLNTCHF